MSDEFVVVSFLDDAAIFEDINTIGILNGGQSVGDNDGGAVLHQFVESLLN